MAEEQKKMTCGCNHAWVLRAFLMVVILGIVFSCGVMAGELKAAARSMRGYGMMDRGGWSAYGRMPMMKGYPADTVNPDSVLYE